MAAFGLCADDFSEDDGVAVWPCNRRAVQLFAALSTQWRSGFAGAYGLDYAAVAAVMQLWRVKPKKQVDLLADICTMERAVLEMWQEKRK